VWWHYEYYTEQFKLQAIAVIEHKEGKVLSSIGTGRTPSG
jgi:hypothetical protein